MTLCPVQSFVPTADVSAKAVATTAQSEKVSGAGKGFAGLFNQELSTTATKSDAAKNVLSALQKTAQSVKQNTTDAASLNSLLALLQSDNTSSTPMTAQELLALARTLQGGQVTTKSADDAKSASATDTAASTDKSEETKTTDNTDLMSALLGMMGLTQQQSTTALPSIKNLSDLLNTISESNNTGTQAQAVQALGSMIKQLQSLLEKTSGPQTQSTTEVNIAAALSSEASGTDAKGRITDILASFLQTANANADMSAVSLETSAELPHVMYFVSTLANAADSTDLPDTTSSTSDTAGLLAVDLTPDNTTQTAVEKLQALLKQLENAQHKSQEKPSDTKTIDASFAALLQQQSVTTVATSDTPTSPTPIDHLDSVVPQTQAAMTDMVERMRGNVQFDTTAMKATIQLDPPALGHVQIHLTIDDNNNLQAQLGSDNPDTQRFLQQHQQQMRDELAQQGFKEDQMEFTFEELEPAAA